MVSPCLENAWMTGFACHLCGVGRMDKSDVSGRLNAKGDVPDRVAAPAGRKGEGTPAVAGAARFPFFHFGHGYGAFALCFVDLFVADVAVIFNRLVSEVFLMAEDDGTS